MAAKRIKLGVWSKLAIGGLAMLVLFGLIGVSLRYWITSSGGRAFIVSQIDGRRLGPLGVIRLSGLEGDPLKAATVTDIALVDDDGIWLRAKNARIEWSPFKLFSGELEIRAAEIRTVDISRRPRTTEETKRRPPPNIGVRLDDLAIDQLRIADGVFGPKSSYKIGAGVARGQDGAGFLRVGVMPLTGPGDRLEATAKWTAGGSVTGEAEAFGPARGAFAGLLQAPEGAAVAINAKIDGAFEAFEASMQVKLDNLTVADVAMSRKNDAANLRAKLDVGAWPLFDVVAQRTGGPIVLVGQASLADPAKATGRIEMTAPAGRVELSGPVNFEDLELGQPLQVRATNIDLSRISESLKGQLDADGKLRGSGLVDWMWEGDAAVAGFAAPSVEARRLAGKAQVRQQGTIIAWQALDAAAQGASVTSLNRLEPADYETSVRGTFNLTTRIVDVSQAQLRGRAGSATGRGTFANRTGAMEFSGAASLESLADVAPASGSARGQWSVKRSSRTAPIRVSVDATGRNVASRTPALNQLLGPSPRVVLTAVTHRGNTVIESGRLDGAAVLAVMSGRIDDSGAISGVAEGRLRRPLTLGAAELTSLGLVAAVSGDTSAPRVSIDIEGGAVSAAGLSFTGIDGDIDATLGRRTAGRLALAGSVDGQPMKLAGRIAGGDGAWRLVDVQGSVGGVEIVARQLAYEAGVFRASFGADGSLGGLAGIDAGTLTARGDIVAGNGELDFRLNGQAANLKRGELRLQLVAFEGEADGERATLSGRVQGDLGAPVNLAYSADGRREDDGGWRGQANLSGQVDKQAVATTRPVAWSYGPRGWSTEGQLSAFGGRIEMAAANGAAGASSRVEVADVDLIALTRLARINPITGRLSGRSTFSNNAAGATADLSFNVAGANPLGVTADPVSLKIDGQLRSGRFTAVASGQGQGFELKAQGGATFSTGEGFNVAPVPNGPVVATLDLQGRAEQLWALFGPEGQTLKGVVDADVRVAGTMASPTLEGDFALDQGTYEQADTGLRLTQVSAKGVFDRRSARIQEVSAADGFGGSLSGDGSFNWENGLGGKIHFTAANLRAMGRDDRFAVVSGNGAVELASEAIRVTGEMNVAQARFSIEQPAAATIPVLPNIRRISFANRADETEQNVRKARPILLDIDVAADRRVVVFGRGLDSEWSAKIRTGGTTSAPLIEGQAGLVRGDLVLAGKRFDLDSGTIRFDGPISQARVNILASRTTAEITARVRVTGSPDDLEFKLESTPTLPQDEILARVLFGRSASQLSAFEAAQIAAGLAQLAGGTAAFDPAGLLRQATGFDRIAFGASGGGASVAAGKYIAEDVYVQLGATGSGLGAEVEWEPTRNVSIISSTQGSGDTKIAVRWKTDY